MKTEMQSDGHGGKIPVEVPVAAVNERLLEFAMPTELGKTVIVATS